MEILLKNIQSIKEAHFDLPDTGLVQLKGANSNGKSILVNTIAYITSMRILDNEARRTLISDWASFGTITMRANDNKVLFVKLHEDRNQSFVALCRNEENKVVRTFRDGGIIELLNEFGFRMYNNNSICIQVFETYGVFPFVNTTYRQNFEMIDSITTDTVAQEFLNNFKTITREKAKRMLKELSVKVNGLKNEKANLVMYNVDAYSSLYNRMKEVYDVVNFLTPIKLPYIHIPPKVTYLDIEPPNLQKIELIAPMPVVLKLVNLTETLRQIEEVVNGKCPTCGKKLIDCEEV